MVKVALELIIAVMNQFSLQFPTTVSEDIAASIWQDQPFFDKEILTEQLKLYIQ